MQTMWSYLRLVARPIPLAGDLATVVQAVLLAVAAIAGGTVLGVAVSRSAAIVGVLVILLLLLAVAGVRLQLRVDDRGPLLAVEQEIMGAWEEVNWSLDPFVGQRLAGVSRADRDEALVDSASRTEAYVRLVLGPVAASRLADPHTSYPTQRALTEAYAGRLLAIAEQIDGYTIRVDRSKLAQAGQTRSDNALRHLLVAHPRESIVLSSSGAAAERA